MWRWVSVAVAVLFSAVCALPASAAPPDPPSSAGSTSRRVVADGLRRLEWDTNLHSGLNSDFTKQVRPIGRVRAVMIFVDFSDAQASDANPNQGGRNWQLQQSYWDFLKQSVDFFNRPPTGASSSTSTSSPTSGSGCRSRPRPTA